MPTPLATIRHLAPDVQYCLDAAIDNGDISADVWTFLVYYHPNTNQWFDALEAAPHHALKHAAIAAYLSWRKTAPRDDIVHCVVEGFIALQLQMEVAVDSGAMCALRMLPPGIGVKGSRQMQSPNFMRRVCRRDTTCVDFINTTHRIANDAVLTECARGLDSATPILDLLNQRRAELRQAMALQQERLEQKNRKQTHQKRKTIRRSLDLMSSVIGEHDARVFISGDEVTIEGKAFNFLVKKHRAYSAGHGGQPVITVTDKAGVVLSDLCLYFEATPTMDQVAALALHVASGEEDDLIRTGNLYNIKPQATANTALALLKGGTLGPRAAVLAVDDGNRLLTEDESRVSIQDITASITRSKYSILIGRKLLDEELPHYDAAYQTLKPRIRQTLIASHRMLQSSPYFAKGSRHD
jgi:hypothetical protein